MTDLSVPRPASRPADDYLGSVRRHIDPAATMARFISGSWSGDVPAPCR